MLALSAVDQGFECHSSKTKDRKNCICCFFAKHAVLKSKNKDWLAWNQDSNSEWSDMSTSELVLLF